jgi:hypothetical protein
MHMMGHAIAGGGENDAELRGTGLQESMVVGVARIRLDDIMVDVADRSLWFDRINPQRFEFQIHYGSSRVLGQSLVDCQTDFSTFGEFSFHEVLA